MLALKDKLPITVILATKNEESNIIRCISALTEVERIMVIDSKSDDATSRLARDHGAEVFQFNYTGGYPKKRQWALDNLPISSEWVMLLDADEFVPNELWAEIRTAINLYEMDAFLIKKGFHFLGKRFRFGGFSHSAVLLFRKGKARFEHIIDDPPEALDMEVHERLIVNGNLGRLKTPLIHEDCKGIEAFIAKHNKYSTWEAKVRLQYLETGAWGISAVQQKCIGNAQERRRLLKTIVCHLPFEHIWWFINHYIVRLGFLEGRRGLIASRIRSEYISDVRAKIFEMKLNESKKVNLLRNNEKNTTRC
jgi:glycosyltransferase involved in cell wall biosynthesis